MAVAASVGVGVMMKVSENASRTRLSVAFFNYCFALIFSAALWWSAGCPPFPPSVAMTGVFAGVCWVIALVSIMYSVRVIGVAVSSAVVRIAIVLPMGVSMLFWGEFPSLLQWVGIGLAIAAVAVMAWGSAVNGRVLDVKRALMVLGVFAASGFAQLSSKLFAQFCAEELKPSWMIVLFASAILVCGGWMAASGIRPKALDVVYGLGVGIPNSLSAFFLVSALAILPSVVVFPTTSAGGMVALALIGAVFFGERPSRTAAAGIVVAVIAVVLVNIG
ncbi:MAG: hypothetical protein Kow00107_06030 [Planctomycetota bacterium]